MAMVTSVTGTDRVVAARNAPAPTIDSRNGRIANSIVSGWVMQRNPIGTSTNPTPRRIQVRVLSAFISSLNNAAAVTAPGAARAMV
jgi:hypothetical protein